MMYGLLAVKSRFGGTKMNQMMNNGQQPHPMNMNNQTGMQMNHGAHEILDTHEILSGMTTAFNEYLMGEQHIQDNELMAILHRQRQFMTDEYNILVQSFHSGQEPSHPTSTYQMEQSNEVIYGLTPTQPTMPNQQVEQIGDKCVANVMMNCHKSLSSMMTKAAAECTNPVVRRVLADSIPNHIEMAYELFLYQNKKGFYQVPQFTQEDMQQMLNAYAPSNAAAPTLQQGNQLQ